MSAVAGRAAGRRRLVWLVQRTDEPGGVGAIIDDLARHLAARQDWRVERVAQRSAREAETARRSSPPRRLVADAAATWGLARSLRRARPDVVVAFTPLFGVLSAWLARRHGGRCVMTHHTQRAALGRLASWAVTWSAGRGLFAATIACSRSVADGFAGYGPIEVVENGVDDVAHRADPGVDRGWLERHHGVPAHGPLAFAAGRLGPEKGHDVMIDALRQAEPWRLVIAGEGPWRRALEERARAGGTERRVHLVGQLPAPIVWSLMLAADAFVQPSRVEGMSLALLEAMAMGSVIVASAIPANREIVEPHGAGLLAPVDDAASWAEALAGLADHPARGASLRMRARSAFEALPTRAGMLAGYERVIERVLHSDTRSDGDPR